MFAWGWIFRLRLVIDVEFGSHVGKVWLFGTMMDSSYSEESDIEDYYEKYYVSLSNSSWF